MADEEPQTSRMAKLKKVIQDKFYDKIPKTSQIIMWYGTKRQYEESCVKNKTTPPCIICGRIFGLARGVSGIGSKFYRNMDGDYVSECGGRDGRAVCPGIHIVPDAYVDRATITQEIHEAGDNLLTELKHIRDRVLALESINTEDETMFDELTEEYRAIKKIEDEHMKMIETQPYGGTIYTYEDEEGEIFKSPMITTVEGKPFACRDIVCETLCKEDLPVKIM